MTTVKGATKHIEGLKKDKEARLQALSLEIASLEERKAPQRMIDDVLRRRESIASSYDRMIARAEQELDEATVADAKRDEENSKRQAEKARQAEEALKRIALTSYMANGGSPESFEVAWPALRDRLIAEKVSAEVNNGKPGIVL